jgi:hypothetical protein
MITTAPTNETTVNWFTVIKNLLKCDEVQLAQIYCYVNDSADTDKYEWRIFQNRADYLRTIYGYLKQMPNLITLIPIQ